MFKISILSCDPGSTEGSDDDPIVNEIVDIMRQDIHHQSSQIKQRGQHPKSQGCLYAQFSAQPELLPTHLREDLAIGLLSQTKIYPSWVRFSNFRETNDAKGDTHGMAIKLMGVDGEQLEAESGDTTQDFVLIDVPVFFLQGKEAYRDFFRAIASLKLFFRLRKEPFGLPLIFSRLATLGRTIHQIRQFLIPSLIPSQWRFRAVAILVSTLWDKRRHKPSTLLDQEFWSPAPIQWGNRMVKVMVKPWAMNQAPKVKPSPDYLKSQLVDRLTHQRQPAVFDVYLQVANPRVDTAEGESWEQATGKAPQVAKLMNDATVEWSDTDSQTIKIGELTLPPQEFDLSNQWAFNEQLSFSPWHGLNIHQPLGELNQLRRAVYQEVAKLRSQENALEMAGFGFETGQEPTPETFSPTLLAPSPATEQTALTVLVPVQEEQCDELKAELEKISTAIAHDSSAYFGRSPKTHFARLVLFEDPEINIQPQLLFTSNFDGPLELYLQELVETLGAQMEPIWRCCKDYEAGICSDFVRFRQFIDDNALPTTAFYIGCRGVTVQDVLHGQQLRQRLETHMAGDPSLHSTWMDYMKLTPTLPNREKPNNKLPRLVQLARWLGRSVWRGIGVSPEQNDPATREHLSERTKERMERGDQSEDYPGRVQNHLTTLSVLKSDFHLFVLRRVLSLINIVAKLSRGKLSGIGSIHFARWVIVEKGKIDPDRAFLIFTSNYGDNWDGYLDDFVYLTITAMNSIWANLVNYPSKGCQDIEVFKQHSKSRQFPAQVFFSAYPNLSVQNIIGDRTLGLAVKQVGQLLQGNYGALQAVEDHPLMNLVKRINRME